MNDEKKPLKIALLLDKFLPTRGGERYFSFLASELARRGHDVHVFATKVEASDAAELPYKIHLVPVWRFPRSLRILSFHRASARAISKIGFDIVHGAAESSVVNVLNPHGGVEPAYLRQEFSSVSGRFYRLYKMMKRYLSVRHYLETVYQRRLYSSDRLLRVIAISLMIKRDIIQYYGFPEDKISVVFNAVDLDKFHPRNRDIYRAQVRPRLSVEDHEIILLFAGNNFRLKGLETLIRSLAILKDQNPGIKCRLLVAGRGHVRRYLRLARSLNIADRIHFLGAVTAMEQYYGASDIYVHPTFYDSCSLTVLEAMASGLPVVTTRFNGASDAILSRDGGIVMNNPADPLELAQSIMVFIEGEKRKRAGILARSWMEQYSPDRNIDETIAVYRAALNMKADSGNSGTV
jgi:UDP-glucose:(heptosyl)LPS alpha-1,3-glucosyltransferase